MTTDIQVAVRTPGWGHWVRVLALTTFMPQFNFKLYHTSPLMPLPKRLFPNVIHVTKLDTKSPIICEHGWISALPYQQSDFSKTLCIRRVSARSNQNDNWNQFDQILTVSDIKEPGDFPPVVLETPISHSPFPSQIISCNDTNNYGFLTEKYPDYSSRIVFPITLYRQQIRHLVGIAGYNLFWECAYYKIPCTLYRSTFFNDSHRRLDLLGKDPIPASFTNGAPSVARALADWWLRNI